MLRISTIAALAIGVVACGDGSEVGSASSSSPVIASASAPIQTASARAFVSNAPTAFPLACNGCTRFQYLDEAWCSRASSQPDPPEKTWRMGGTASPLDMIPCERSCCDLPPLDCAGCVTTKEHTCAVAAGSSPHRCHRDCCRSPN
ncbi:MAG: hypothetical protein U0271_39335 [Polyangiaceae bacterium]